MIGDLLLHQFDIEGLESHVYSLASSGMSEEETLAHVREELREVVDGQPLWLSVVDEFYRRAMQAQGEQSKLFCIWQARAFMAAMNQAVI